MAISCARRFRPAGEGALQRGAVGLAVPGMIGRRAAPAGFDHRDEVDIDAAAQRILHEMRARPEPQRHPGGASSRGQASACSVARNATRPEKAGASSGPSPSFSRTLRAQAVGADQQIAGLLQRDEAALGDRLDAILAGAVADEVVS